MPLQIIDYSRAPILREPDIIGELGKGLDIGAKPAKLKQEAQQRELANSLQKLALAHKPKEYELADALKHAQISKLNRPAGIKAAAAQKASGDLGNFLVANPHASEAEIKDFFDKSYDAKLRHLNQTTHRGQVLDETQANRDATAITKKHLELKEVEKGFYPGTKEKLSPVLQNKMTNDLMLSIAKDKTDPLTREKLINGTNLNITMDSINPDKLFQYSGAKNAPRKIGDAIKEGLGSGSQNYKDYQGEVNKAIGSAKQLRQYLKDSIQPSNAEKLEHLTNPEAWNVSPELAKKNFLFMKDLLKKETGTLMRATNDASLYESQPQEVQPAQSNGAFSFGDYPVAGKR